MQSNTILKPLAIGAFPALLIVAWSGLSSAAGSPDMIEAREIKLVSADGKNVAVLRPDGLTFEDGKGTKLLNVSVSDGFSRLQIRGADGDVKALVGNAENGGALLLVDNAGRARAQLAVSKSALTGLTIMDGNEDGVLVEIGHRGATPLVELTNAKGKSKRLMP